MHNPAERSKEQLIEDLQVLRIDRRKPTVRRKPRGRKWLLALMISAPCLVALAFITMRLDLGSRVGLRAKTVRVAVARRQSPGGSGPILSAGGYIIARTQVEVGSKTTGRVVSLGVKEGDFVQQGQVAARLDDSEVRAQVSQAQARLAAAKFQSAEVQAGSRPQELDRADAEVERLKADLKNAELRWRRSERLVEEGVVARQELDDAQARYEMALAAHRAGTENYKLARAGSRQETIDASQAAVRQAEAELALAQAQAENTVIRAPITGTVLERYVDVGYMVTTGFTSDRGAKQALLTIANLTDLQVASDISEADIAKVQLKQPTALVPDAYPERRYQGIVDYVGSVADRQKATVKVKVKVLDPDQYLRPNMGAKVTFYQLNAEVPPQGAAVIVPKSAVVTQNGRPVVFIAMNQRAVMQPVTVGREDRGYMEIVNGLQGGETVIISGEVNEGEKITVQS